MNVTVNGEPRRIAPGTTVLEIAGSVRGVAVALNGVVVPASSWAATPLSEDDAVDVVTAHQGG
ncbi:MAG: sulfur carrier protein ThiS [Nocardioidaceae bacterium]